MNSDNHNHRKILQGIAHRAMLERGLLPDFSTGVLSELEHLQDQEFKEHLIGNDPDGIRDLRKLLWVSIDNDDSRDLDQLTTAHEMTTDLTKIRVAIADVDASIKKGSLIDQHARHNTTSVYTAAEIFPMLPEKVSTDITSLNVNEDRLAIVVEMDVNGDGSIKSSNIYRAWVHNYAKLAYNRVAVWLEDNGTVPEDISAVDGLAENLQLQDQAAQSMQDYRYDQGTLHLETIQARPVFSGEQIQALDQDKKNRAKEIIEVFMIAVNGVTARYLSDMKFPSIRRVVRTPKRWDRIIKIAADHHYQLPENPDSKALDDFLTKQKSTDPLRFPDLSLAVIKLLGSGEYMAELPDGNFPGHFGLSVKDYGHSTAPNRRYPDLVTQRLLKAALEGKPVPYRIEELDELAAHCTKKEDDATKVERQVEKSAAAILLETRIGEKFDSIVTGASGKGTWVRLLDIPVEGKLVKGFNGVDVGDQIRVELIQINVEMGFIDFQRIP
jgi:exoribonuclease-2